MPWFDQIVMDIMLFGLAVVAWGVCNADVINTSKQFGGDTSPFRK
jgi:hypothetical protein